MSSPAWSVYEGDWGSFCDDADNVPPFLALKGCGLRQKCLLQRGAQGAVYLGEDADGNVFVVKRLFTQRSEFGVRGVSEGSLREATLLTYIAERSKSLDPEARFGVIRLERIVEAPFQELCLILERCAFDLSRMVFYKRKRAHGGATGFLPEAPTRCPILAKMNVIQYLMRGILKILQFLHEECHIIHRDVKLGNLLVGEDGRVRLADFGSARFMHETVEKMSDAKSGEYTPISLRTTVIYQAPECLLGERSYTAAVDMWAAGVVFAELLLQQHLFHSCSELAMLSDIWRLLGTPSDDPSLVRGEGAVTYAVRTESTIAQKFPESIVPAEGLDLLKRMLETDPKKRITDSEALRHPFLCGPAVESGLEEARLLWNKKVEACMQETVAQPAATGMRSFYVDNVEFDEESGENDDGDDDGEKATLPTCIGYFPHIISDVDGGQGI
ncbi:protein kinase, putative,cdc2, putative [Trypanosoma cruzi marinkellei]|uniref:Protein kinase, putative,cdc2, putative n=1 Tax=Trypanosoma cruzi marinkellei TaxID=85056 RepID=K2NF20_TRYCR|nr:protein kinase, putative,cdc2, putative [Trypanosoma cruzi marinkellei]